MLQLSGYRFGDALAEEGDSFHSDEEDSGRHPVRMDRIHDHNDDSDDFADDEGILHFHFLLLLLFLLRLQP